MAKRILRNFARFAAVSIITPYLSLNVAMFTGGALLALAGEIVGKAFAVSWAATPAASKLALGNDRLLKNEHIDPLISFERARA